MFESGLFEKGRRSGRSGNRIVCLRKDGPCCLGRHSSALTRTYRQGDPRSRDFGRGTTHNYDIFLTGTTTGYTYQELVLADGGRVRFDRISAGTSWTNAVYQNTTNPGPFYGAKIAWNGNGWTLTEKNGTVLIFPESFAASSPQRAALITIRDRNGNTSSFTYNPAGQVLTSGRERKRYAIRVRGRRSNGRDGSTDADHPAIL